MRFIGIICALLTTFLSISCAGRKLRTDLPKNVSVTSVLKDPRNTVNARLFVYAVKPDCDWDHIGSFTLEQGTVDLGLPTGEPLALEFAFAATSMFSANRQTSQKTLFRAKEGMKYDILASYNGGMYFVEIKEASGGRKQGTTIPLISGDACQPAGK